MSRVGQCFLLQLDDRQIIQQQNQFSEPFFQISDCFTLAFGPDLVIKANLTFVCNLGFCFNSFEWMRGSEEAESYLAG